MKKKKIYALAGLLFLAAILFFLSLMGSSSPDIQSQDVILRTGTKDVSIDDMIKTSENRKLPSNNDVAPGFGDNLSGNRSGQSSDKSDNPEAIARIQQLIRENNDNLSSGLQDMENERQGVVTYQDERDVHSTVYSTVPPPDRSGSRPTMSSPSNRDSQSNNVSASQDPEPEEDVEPEPKKRSPFNSISMSSATNKNAIKAYVHSEQTVSDGSTLKMRLGEDAYTDNGTLIPKNSPIFGTVTSVDGERVNVKITHVNHQGNILPFEKLVYSKDALLGIYVPGNPKSEATKDAASGAIDGLPVSGIPGVDAAAQIATTIASSAAQAGKQAISKNVKKIKVTIKTNYEIFLRPDDKKNR